MREQEEALFQLNKVGLSMLATRCFRGCHHTQSSGRTAPARHRRDPEGACRRESCWFEGGDPPEAGIGTNLRLWQAAVLHPYMHIGANTH